MQICFFLKHSKLKHFKYQIFEASNSNHFLQKFNFRHSSIRLLNSSLNNPEIVEDSSRIFTSSVVFPEELFQSASELIIFVWCWYILWIYSYICFHEGWFLQLMMCTYNGKDLFEYWLVLTMSAFSNEVFLQQVLHKDFF